MICANQRKIAEFLRCSACAAFSRLRSNHKRSVKVRRSQKKVGVLKKSRRTTGAWPDPGWFANKWLSVVVETGAGASFGSINDNSRKAGATTRSKIDMTSLPRLGNNAVTSLSVRENSIMRRQRPEGQRTTG